VHDFLPILKGDSSGERESFSLRSVPAPSPLPLSHQGRGESSKRGLAPLSPRGREAGREGGFSGLRISLRPLSSLLLALLLSLADTAAQAAPSLVLLVRHAEKASVPGDDPGLSAAGEARAQALATAMAEAHVGAILTSPLRRTRDTAAATAAAAGLKPQAIGFEGGTAAHVAAVAAAVRAQDAATVLVVGHSNTVPAILKALGGPALPDFCESSYGHLLVLSLDENQPRLLRTRYGAADPAPTPGCL
jgi:phosphohistidine phosphatase SixA